MNGELQSFLVEAENATLGRVAQNVDGTWVAQVGSVAIGVFPSPIEADRAVRASRLNRERRTTWARRHHGA